MSFINLLLYQHFLMFSFCYFFVFFADINDKENLKPKATPKSRGLQCSYFNCTNRAYTKDGQRTACHFFKVPLQNPMRTTWANRMGKKEGKDGFMVTNNTKVCDSHFSSEDILKAPGGKRWRLKDGAIPFKASHTPAVSLKRKPPSLRSAPIISIKKAKVETRTYCQPKSLQSSALAVVHELYKDLVHENKKTKCDMRRIQDELDTVREELDTTKAEVRERTFGMDVIKDNDELCQYYTGFQNYERLKTCFTFLSVGEHGENVRMRGSTEKKVSGRPRCLNAEDQFLLLLIKLRTGFSNIHLGWLFNCDGSTITRLTISWLNYVYLKFCTLPIWPSREDINASMPQDFKEKFPNTRVIIDCTEIAVESPESLHTRAVYYSDYKHHNTYKALIGITPAGGLSFVSELFPGSISDREIVSRCGILNPMFWDKGDEIMADKGFTIRDLLDEMGVKLNIPIFLEDRPQFSAEQVIINQRISSLRIHVERFISGIKNFHIFDRPLPLSMHGSANQIFTMCSFLVMFQNPIISA